VKILDAGNGTVLRVLDTCNGDRGQLTGLAFSPDSKRLATTGVWDRKIEIWDVSREALLR
jgi:WD40 repeat protein